MAENDFSKFQVLVDEQITKEFESIFQGVNLNNPSILPERKLASLNNIKRSDVNSWLKILKYNGLVKGKQGSGNYLVTSNPKATATNSLKNNLFYLIHFKYVDSKEVNQTREKLELMIFDDWCLLSSNEQRRRMLQLEYHSINMEEALHEDSTLSDGAIDKIIENDICFHEILGCSTENTFISILIDAMSQLRIQEIKNFWINANPSQKETLIESHFLIIDALKTKNIEKRKTAYINAIKTHYNGSKL